MAVTEQISGQIVDGRRARRARGRRAVLDAVIDLLQERGRAPTTAEISERSGVSPATIFRYFDSLDELQHEATRHHFERSRHYFEVPELGLGTRHDRIHRFVASRVALHDHIAPVARFGRSRALDQPYLAENLREVRRWQADLVRRHFAPELAELTSAGVEDLVSVISSVTSFEAWDQQRHDLGRSERQVRRAWTDALSRLLP